MSLVTPRSELDLSNLGLEGVLPPVPLARELLIRGNPGLTGFASLPPNLLLLDAKGCGLEQLPHLPETLEQLDISGNNRLRTLPRLPPSVWQVLAANCGLQRLEPFPDGSRLSWLSLSGNPLTALPEMPERLQDLQASGCRLTTLPAIAGSFFRSADFSNNQIVDISQPLPNSTTGLNLLGNPLHLDTLPAWMLGLRQLEISFGHLPNAVQVHQRISQQVRSRNGPRILSDMIDSNNRTQAGPARLEDAVAAWLGEAPEAQAQGQAWRAFANEDGAQAFTQFLNRLATTTNNVGTATREPFRQGVRHLLTDMEHVPIHPPCGVVCCLEATSLR